MTEKTLKEIAKVFVSNNGWCSDIVTDEYPILEQLYCEDCPFTTDKFHCTIETVYRKACEYLSPEELMELKL